MTYFQLVCLIFFTGQPGLRGERGMATYYFRSLNTLRCTRVGTCTNCINPVVRDSSPGAIISYDQTASLFWIHPSYTNQNEMRFLV